MYHRVLISNWQEHHDLGARFVNAVDMASGTNYTTGNSAKLMYPATGGSDDYAASIGIDLAYTIELYGDVGSFNPPVHLLERIVTETFAGLSEFGKYAAEKWKGVK